MRLFVLTWVAVMATAAASTAQEVVYVIRHAEKELSGDDPSITEVGRARAAAWAEMLLYAGLDVVFTSDAKRTQQTGDIIAGKLGLPINSMNRDDTAALIDTLNFDHEEDTVLIVGHAETIPGILENLGASADTEISQSDFANLFILIDTGTDQTRLIQMQMP